MRVSFWPGAKQTWSDILDLGLHVEAAGWDGLWIADHFMPNAHDLSEPCHEVFVTLAGLAARVPRLRIGSLVASNTYRHPAVLANMAATLDHVSGGRLVLGLGAGWQENEHAVYGLEFHTVAGRLRRLEEACRVVKALFTDRRVSFDGRYYQLHDAPLEPKPLQDTVPLMIGGGGEKVTLRIVASHADEWNVWATLDTFKHKRDVLERHCESVGRDPAAIQKSVAVLLVHTDDQAKVRDLNESNPARATVAGNAEQLLEIFAGYAQAGLDELIVPDFNMPSGTAKLEMLDRFHDEVGRHL